MLYGGSELKFNYLYEQLYSEPRIGKGEFKESYRVANVVSFFSVLKIFKGTIASPGKQVIKDFKSTSQRLHMLPYGLSEIGEKEVVPR
jgi:hypothetical protein